LAPFPANSESALASPRAGKFLQDTGMAQDNCLVILSGVWPLFGQTESKDLRLLFATYATDFGLTTLVNPVIKVKSWQTW
jgi:hypothetical protein